MKQTYFITNLQSLPHVTLSGSVSVPAPNKHFRRTPSDWILYFITNGSMLLQEEDTIYHLSAGPCYYVLINATLVSKVILR